MDIKGTPQEPGSHRRQSPISWDNYSNERVELNLTGHDLNHLQNKVTELESVSLAELAELNPNQAYKLVRLVIRSMIMIRKINFVDIDGSVIAQESDTSDTERAIMTETLFESLPDGDGQAFDFSLGIKLTEEDRKLFGIDDERMEVLAMHVDPPDLANL